MEIILFTGGAAGDLVTATIDPRGYIFNENHILPLIDPITKIYERIKLRNAKALSLMTDEDRDEYIKNSPWNALASHAYEYHVKKKHNFILIDSSDIVYSKWAANRYNSIWPNKTPNGLPMNYNYHITNFNLAKDFTKRIITLKDIVEGNLISRLETLTGNKFSDILYKKWLVHNKF